MTIGPGPEAPRPLVWLPEPRIAAQFGIDWEALADLNRPDSPVRIGWLPTDPDGELPPDAADVQFVFLGPPSPAAGRLLARLPALRVVQTIAAGVDAYLPYIPAGVTLSDGSGLHDISVSEWVLAVLLSWVRRLPQLLAAQAEHRWAPERSGELAGKTVLILGYGSIGEAVERRLVPFDTHVLRVTRTARDDTAGIEDLDELLPSADAVVVLTPLTPATRHLVDARFLARMRDGALLINAARGPVLDTGALLAELRTGRLSAALDVTDPEPLPAEHPLWAEPGVQLTPHVGGNTDALGGRAVRLVRAQILRYAAGEPLANIVRDGY